MKQRKPLTPAALDRIYGARLIKANGFDRSAIVKFARRWMRDQKVSWGHAQRHAWAVARGQQEIARAYDAAPKTTPAQIEWRMAA
jgi:hypothetical protein